MQKREFQKTALFAILLGLTLLGCSGEPTDGGYTLTYWLQENWYDAPQAVRALRAIGTNALPYLLKGIKNPYDPLPGPMTPEWKAQHQSVPPELLIVRGFKALGDLAEPAIPELAKLTQNTNRIVADNALESLALIGPKGFSSLFAATGNPQHPYRGRAVFLLGATHFLGTNAEPVVAELVKLMDDPAVNEAAAHALGELHIRADLSVPALAKAIQNTNGAANLRAMSATALIWFNDQAAPALPALTNALADPDQDVRDEAANVIRHIHNEQLRKAQEQSTAAPHPPAVRRTSM